MGIFYSKYEKNGIDVVFKTVRRAVIPSKV